MPPCLFPKPSAGCNNLQQKPVGLRLLLSLWGCERPNSWEWWWSSAGEQLSPCPACIMVHGQPTHLFCSWIKPHFPQEISGCGSQCHETLWFMSNSRPCTQENPSCSWDTHIPALLLCPCAGRVGLALGQESDQLIWRPNLNFWGPLGFGSLSWCEIEFGAGLEFLFLSACWGLPAWGKDMHVCAGTSQIQGSPLHPSPIPALREVRLELVQPSEGTVASCW